MNLHLVTSNKLVVPSNLHRKIKCNADKELAFMDLQNT